jgi:hypothetical protein
MHNLLEIVALPEMGMFPYFLTYCDSLVLPCLHVASL